MSAKKKKKETRQNDKPAELTTFIVGILHNHGGEFGTTIGQVKATSAKDALKRARSWLKRKREKLGCDHSDNACAVSLREPSGLKGICLLCGAEKIK